MQRPIPHNATIRSTRIVSIISNSEEHHNPTPHAPRLDIALSEELDGDRLF